MEELNFFYHKFLTPNDLRQPMNVPVGMHGEFFMMGFYDDRIQAINAYENLYRHPLANPQQVFQVPIFVIDRDTARNYVMNYVVSKRDGEMTYRYQLARDWLRFVRDRNLDAGRRVRFSWRTEPRILCLRCIPVRAPRSLRIVPPGQRVWTWANFGGLGYNGGGPGGNVGGNQGNGHQGGGGGGGNIGVHVVGVSMGSCPQAQIMYTSNNTYDMFGPVNLFWSTRYDKAMKLFLTCLKDFSEFARMKDLENNIPPDKCFKLPYRIENDKVEAYTITQSFNKPENWTKALKYTLCNLKWALFWLVGNTSFQPLSSSS